MLDIAFAATAGYFDGPAAGFGDACSRLTGGGYFRLRNSLNPCCSFSSRRSFCLLLGSHGDFPIRFRCCLRKTGLQPEPTNQGNDDQRSANPTANSRDRWRLRAASASLALAWAKPPLLASTRSTRSPGCSPTPAHPRRQPILGLLQLVFVQQAAALLRGHPLGRLRLQPAAGLLGRAALAQPLLQARPAGDQRLVRDVHPAVGIARLRRWRSAAGSRSAAPASGRTGPGRRRWPAARPRSAGAGCRPAPRRTGSDAGRCAGRWAGPPRAGCRRRCWPGGRWPPAGRCGLPRPSPGRRSAATAGRFTLSHSSTSVSCTSGSTPRSPAASAISLTASASSTVTPTRAAGSTMAAHSSSSPSGVSSSRLARIGGHSEQAISSG